MDHLILNTSDGVYCCGENNCGQLGLGDYENRNTLTKLELSKNLEIVSIHCRYGHTIINTTDGIYVCGYDKKRIVNVPTKLEFGSLIDQGCSLGEALEIISIHCGNEFTIINTTDGIFVSGSNSSGKLGLGDKIKSIDIPKKLELKHEIISICCGGAHTIVNTSDGLYAFGYNYDGQLGLGDNESRYTPTKLNFFNETSNIISICCGECYTIINTPNGLYVFGDNYYGQLGLGDYKNTNVPTKLNFFNNTLEIISINCGSSHTIINTTDGVYVCGDNRCGQLGLGNDKHEYRNPLIKLQTNYEIIFIQCADDHTIINTTNGLYVCGDNDYGQLGLGDELPRYVLTKLKFDHEIYPFDNVSKHKNIKSAQFSV